jgi:BirA family biotin operon repressor/biotin-[acetyl-CoA-carboxylase] ligase
LLAEHQSGGHGRRGRSWIAPPGGAICLSIAWQYPDMPADLSSLSLVAGVAAANALASLGIPGLRLKWPNDLFSEAGKLGGILIEMRAEAAGPVHLVVGLGLNVMLSDSARATIAAAGNIPDDLRTCMESVPDRNVIVAALLESLLPALEAFPRSGFTPHMADWEARDTLQGREVRIEYLGEIVRGIARGVDAHGALLVETPEDGVLRFISGEVTVRFDR